MDDKKARILIVDDDASARSTLEALLHSEGYQLAFAKGGPEALHLLGDAEIDVILLDVMMPDMDGYQVCQQLKASELWRNIPVILVTALDQTEDLVRGLDSGADDFVHKPVRGAELRARVRSMLRIKRGYDALEQTARLREDLANMVIHDMRSPLTAILGYSGLLMDRFQSAEDLEDMARIQRAASRLNSYANELLMLAKAQDGILLLERKPVALDCLVERALADQSIFAKGQGVTLVSDLTGYAGYALLDEYLFGRVLDNLVSNAIKFSPRQSTVTVRATSAVSGIGGTSPCGLCLQVLDQGPGIAKEYRERIFDKYEIGPLRRENVQVGLGLAFCKMVVDSHGGRIYVADNEPMGSVFTVELDW